MNTICDNCQRQWQLSQELLDKVAEANEPPVRTDVEGGWVDVNGSVFAVCPQCGTGSLISADNLR